MGKIESMRQTIKPQHSNVLSLLGYLQLCIIVAIIVLAILGNWKAMTIFIFILISVLVFTYKYFSNVLNRGGLQDE